MTASVQPVTFYIPSTAGEPVEIDVATRACAWCS